MKTHRHFKSLPEGAPPPEPSAGALRPPAFHRFETRHERRKIRAQLRRLEWAPNVADEVMA